MEIHFTLSVGSLVLGFLIGITFAFFVAWIVEKEIDKDNKWHVGFSQGWDRGCEYGEERAAKDSKKMID